VFPDRGRRNGEEFGVARVSFGPWTQRAKLTRLSQLAAVLYAGGALPEGIRPLT
jgi:2-methylisocitrate lyase-like PEP mutase family enzyme